jgi:hypothetical protein
MSVSILDNKPYIERRVREADDASAQIDALAAHAARRFMAIAHAVRRLRAVRGLAATGWMDTATVLACLDSVARQLEEANQFRATDAPEPRKELRDEESRR